VSGGVWSVKSLWRAFDHEAYELFLSGLSSARATDIDASFAHCATNPKVFFHALSMSTEDMKEFRSRVRELGCEIDQRAFDPEEAIARSASIADEQRQFVVDVDTLRNSYNELLDGLSTATPAAAESRLEVLVSSVEELHTRRLRLVQHGASVLATAVGDDTPLLVKVRFDVTKEALTAFSSSSTSAQLDDIRAQVVELATRAQRRSGNVTLAAPSLGQELDRLMRRFPVLRQLRVADGGNALFVKVDADTTVRVGVDSVTMNISQAALAAAVAAQIQQAATAAPRAADAQFDDI
jgi:hypothetical protein